MPCSSSSASARGPLLLLLPLLVACGGAEAEKADDSAAPAPSDRAAGDRTPLSAACDGADAERCLLPWPSNTFTVVDENTATGLRINVQDTELPGTRADDATLLRQADGFSRLTQVATMFGGGVDEAFLGGLPHGSYLEDAPLRVINVTPGHPNEGQSAPMWMEVVQDDRVNNTDLLVAYPLVPFDENADYLVYITDDLVDEAGQPHVADRWARVSLGLDAPAGEEELALAAYHAPSRARLTELGVDLERVVRVWDFTTRSNETTYRRLDAMMAQADASLGDVTVTIDAFVPRSDPGLAGIVVGSLSGVPNFLNEENRFVYDENGLPVQQGTHEAKFRVAVPSVGFGGGDGDYRVALYGHGTGGSVADDAFDADIASLGVAKVNLEFLGWTGDDLIFTLRDLLTLMRGSEQSTSQLLQAVVDGRAILGALNGPLGEALRAEQIAGEPNPEAGRGPDLTDPAWVGGSLGGTMGAIIGSAYPEIKYGVLNVPAGGWMHFVADSLMYDTALRGFLVESYGSEIDARYAMTLVQGCWDDVDGAAWADRAKADGDAFLMQQSIGDPVVPNQATNILANAMGASTVGPMISPVYGLPAAETVVNGVGLTQFRVPDTGPFDVHGFAARDTPAGAAAMEQIFSFMLSAWEGSPTVEFPESCAGVSADGACDWGEGW